MMEGKVPPSFATGHTRQKIPLISPTLNPIDLSSGYRVIFFCKGQILHFNHRILNKAKDHFLITNSMNTEFI